MDEGHSVIAASPRPGWFSVQCGSASPLRSASHCRTDVGRQGRDLERRCSQSQLFRKVA
ncbi:Sulfate/thiosulfate import ATP-binding protein CysA 1, partial [Dissostichus eleginoides]